MKRFIYLPLVLFVLGNSAHAQKAKLGFRAGANFSEWSDSETMDYDPLVGMLAGPYVNLSASELLSFELGLYYSQKGTKSYRAIDRFFEDDHHIIERHNSHRIAYLDFPVIARLTLWKGLNVYAGPQFSVLLRNKTESEGRWVVNGKEHLSDDTNYDKSMFNTLDLGIVAGLDYQFNNGLNLNAGYDYGVYKVYKESWDPDLYNRGVKVSLGYLF